MAQYAVSNPSTRAEIRAYVLDMIAQLAVMARDIGDMHLAALLERVLATATAGAREH